MHTLLHTLYWDYNVVFSHAWQAECIGKAETLPPLRSDHLHPVLYVSQHSEVVLQCNEAELIKLFVQLIFHSGQLPFLWPTIVHQYPYAFIFHKKCKQIGVEWCSG